MILRDEHRQVYLDCACFVMSVQWARGDDDLTVTAVSPSSPCHSSEPRFYPAVTSASHSFRTSDRSSLTTAFRNCVLLSLPRPIIRRRRWRTTSGQRVFSGGPTQFPRGQWCCVKAGAKSKTNVATNFFSSCFQWKPCINWFRHSLFSNEMNLSKRPRNPVKCSACAVARKIESDCLRRNLPTCNDPVVRISRN